MASSDALPARPSTAQMDRLAAVTAPFARIVDPYLEGSEQLPPRRVLYVGNHTLYGFLDLPFMMAELWSRRGIVVRGLGEHGHYAIPVWRDLLEMGGMVGGTRDNVRELMRQGENVLVFPGGAGEVFKLRGEQYRLKWKERLGFARLAIEFGYPIAPFAAVGAEDMLTIVADRETPVVGQISALMKRLVGLPLPPLVRGVGPTPIPRPERLYFSFAETIDTSRFGGDASDENARVVRDEVRAAVEQGIDRLLEARETDHRRGLIGRLLEAPELPAIARRDPDAWFVMRAFEAWNASGLEGAAAWLSRWVRLADPPDWPGSATWRGRDAVLGRLGDVAAGLGADYVSVEDARSRDGRVDCSFRVHSADETSDGTVFRASIGLEDDQIVEIQVFAGGAAVGR